MKKVELQCFEDLKISDVKLISNDLNIDTLISTLSNELAFHFSDKASSNFQQFYFKSINNSNFYFNSKDFFNQFKSIYSLQGITNQYLQFLKKNKNEIFNLINKNKLSKLSFKYFAKAKSKQKNGVVTKNLGSFFEKLVHTITKMVNSQLLLLTTMQRTIQ